MSETKITGRDLIEWGLESGPWFGEAIRRASVMYAEGYEPPAIVRHIRENIIPKKTTLLAEPGPFSILLDAANPDEQANRDAVEAHMSVLMRVPTLVRGAVMPDGCPQDHAPGTIPVGGVVSARNAIHPGMHSADICCSVAMSVFGAGVDTKVLLDSVMATTHFGPGGRRDPISPPASVMSAFEDNPFLRGLEELALRDFASQGDGNHFAYVGILESSGEACLVTHHGSRGLGAALFKRGAAVAKRNTARIAPEVAGHNAWIVADSQEGQDYWAALQVIREWTKWSHFALHKLAGDLVRDPARDFMWNEHNFVFQKADGLFYHGKGATPSWNGYANDETGLTLIPLNMSEPILVTTHRNNDAALGFAPHGAGRNMSRTQHLKRFGDFKIGRTEGGYLSVVSGGSPELEAELRLLSDKGLDIRAFCGVPDLSELPSAYKDATAVQAQIAKYDLAAVADRVLPRGSVMAGDWEKDAPWKKAREEKRRLAAERAAEEA